MANLKEMLRPELLNLIEGHKPNQISNLEFSTILTWFSGVKYLSISVHANSIHVAQTCKKNKMECSNQLNLRVDSINQIKQLVGGELI